MNDNVVDISGRAKRASGRRGSMPAEDLSQDKMALRFTEAHCHRLKFVAPHGVWMFFNGKYWERDERQYAAELVRESIRKQVEQYSGPARLKSRSSVKSILELASSDPRHVIHVNELDPDPLKLCCPDGVYILNTGERVAHTPEDLITRITSTSPTFDDAPKWVDTINQWTCERTDLATYLQRLSGYQLIGKNPLEIFAILYGGGRNGKSKFCDTLAHVMGSYATQAPSGLFLSAQAMNEDNALSDLAGYRAVRQEENRPGVPLREDAIKRVTGSEYIKTRPLYGKYIEQKIAFLVMLAVNYLPPLSAVDAAIKRRVHLIPFDFECPAELVDDRLMDTLINEEAPAILGWAIMGAVDFHQQGLHKAQCMLDAEAAYFEEEDSTGKWISDNLERSTTTAQLRSGQAYKSYKAWCDENGVLPASNKQLTRELTSRGFCKHTDRRGSYFAGWRIVGDFL